MDNVEEAMQPLFTSRPDLERSGMGFTVMETFMDSLEVHSEKGKGTKVTMKKTFKSLS
jgi:stage II sporulation protein AB (anti-sigma F factor)